MTERIVSLLASGTEIVSALGLEDRLVGISHECDFPPRVLDRPRVSRPRFEPDGLDSGGLDRAVRRAMAEHGSVYALDGDTLEGLSPDLVLTQAVCDVCAVPAPGVRDEILRRGLDTRVLSLDAHTVDDVLESIEDVGRAAGAAHRAREAVARLRGRIAEVHQRTRGLPRPTVLALEWLDPVFTPGHWVPEMIDRAGGRNLSGEAGGRSEQRTWEEVGGLDPDVLLIMPCGYDLEASRADADRHARRLVEVAPRAVEEGRAFVVDGSSYFNRSGPRVVDGIEILAGLLHPGSFPGPDPSRATGWQPAGTRRG